MSLINSFSEHQKSLLLSNPHSASATSPNLTQVLVKSTRLKVLKLFKADPKNFEVIFVANATAAAKLVFEAFRDHEQGYDYFYHRDCHTSLVGGRQWAQNHACLGGENADEVTEDWLKDANSLPQKRSGQRPTLFAYPGQSNMNGRRLPLSWPSLLRKDQGHPDTYVLLDVAALVSTCSLDLSNHETAPDFLTLSFYKIFGFPNLGALIVNKRAAHIFKARRYFGGGTTDLIACGADPWVAKKKDLCASLEDGTGPAYSVLALNCAIDEHEKLFGSLAKVSQHTAWLASQLYEQLGAMKHTNGQPLCEIYKDEHSTYGDSATQGGTVSFNVHTPDGGYVDTVLVSNEAMAKSIHIRAGSLCNPAGMACTLGFNDTDLRNVHDSGLRCGDQSSWSRRPLGMVRVSFGACSTLEDALIFVRFLQESFVDRHIPEARVPLVGTRKPKSVDFASIRHTIASPPMACRNGAEPKKKKRNWRRMGSLRRIQMWARR